MREHLYDKIDRLEAGESLDRETYTELIEKRHELSGICNSKKLCHGSGVHGKSCFTVCQNTFFQLTQPPDPSDKINAGVFCRLPDSQHRLQQIVLQQSHIQSVHLV